ncbi:hypothetical protein OAJ04_03365 [Candidatus Nitrosopelagicus sp.]|nr:hypothetical protein [Candidatus Nitrosopelagicus sp.]
MNQIAFTGMIACFAIGFLVLVTGVFLHATTLFDYSLHISVGILLILIGLVLKFVKTWDWKQRFSDQ